MNDYNSTVVFPHRMVGHEVAAGVFTKSTSAQRLSMMSKNYTQWVELVNPEFPRIFSGIESMFGEYTFDMSPVPDQDVIVLKVSSKYGNYHVDYNIKENPTYCVFYKGVVDKKIGYFEVSTYKYLSREFGFHSKIINRHLLSEGVRIEKGTVFNESPAVQGDRYCMGVNANVVYLPILPTTADAFVISKSLAKRLSSNIMNEVFINIDEKQVPLNIFGSKEGEHKFFPDIGEYINDTGILAALRPNREAGMFTDYLEEQLKIFNPLSDIPYKLPPGSKVIDVDVYTATNKLMELKSEDSIYNQLKKYQHHLFNYYNDFLKVYSDNQDATFTSDLTNKIVKYAMMLPVGKNFQNGAYQLSKMGKGGKDRRLTYKGVEIELCLLRLITSIIKPAGIGSKLTGRDGSKGVVCLILDDEDMPRDEFGFVADIIINSNSIPNRMNISQLWEQFINRLSDLVIMDSMHMDVPSAYKYISSYISDVDPFYGKLVREITFHHQERAVKEWRENKIHINVPGDRQHYGKKHHDYLKKKWNYRIGKVTMTYPIDEKGERKRTITFKKPECIGSKYLFLINKRPHATAVEMAYGSHLQLPIKNKDAKLRSISPTPIRFGEEEFKNLPMGTKPVNAARILNLYANCPEEAKELFYQGLVQPNPSRFQALDITNEELIERSIPLKLSQHIMAAAGTDITPTAFYKFASEEEI